jgi:chromosome partitioning protein
MRAIAIANQKGGVGKTTSVVNIGTRLSNLEYRVLVIDLDPQANLTYAFGLKDFDKKITIFEVLKGEVPVERAIIKKNNLQILGSSSDLYAFSVEYDKSERKEFFLKNSLDHIAGVDFILIDCPPNLGLLTLNALTAVDEVIIPLQAEFLSIKGLQKMLDEIETIKKILNPGLKIAGLLITFYDQRLRLHNEVAKNLRMHFREIMFKTVIRKNIALAEASSFGQPIYEYSAKSYGAVDYARLCSELIEMRRKNGREIKAQ